MERVDRSKCENSNSSVSGTPGTPGTPKSNLRGENRKHRYTLYYALRSFVEAS